VGFSDQAIFPEIELDKIKRQIGFDFIFVTSAKTDAQAKAMLKALGMPFRDNRKEEDAA
jgi:large subunit ribosomal protein L5